MLCRRLECGRTSWPDDNTAATSAASLAALSSSDLPAAHARTLACP